jgi:hypothetical protein
MKRLLVVYHSQFGATRQMAEAAAAGARAIADVDTLLRSAGEAGVPDLLAADAVLIAASENFGALAGRVKDFFERVYYPCLERIAGRGYATLICAANDGSGALRDIDRIAKGLGLVRRHPGVLFRSGVTAQPTVVPPDVLEQCAETGATLAARLAAGIG